MEERSTTNRRGPYAKTTVTRDAIIQTALDYFGRHGYHGVSMREIARHVGLSQAGLLHHFPTKTDLLTAVLESRDERSVAAALDTIERAADPLAGLLAVIADNTTRRPLVQMFLVLSAEATDEDHPAHEYFRHRSRRVIAVLRTALAQAQAGGLIAPDIDLDGAARQGQALMYGLQAQWLLDPATDMVATFEQFVGQLRGPGPDGGAEPEPGRASTPSRR